MADAAKFNQPLPATAGHFVDQAGSFLGRVGDGVLTAMVNLAEGSHAARKAREFKALSDLSDAELEARGLTRDALPVHVFGKYYV